MEKAAPCEICRKTWDGTNKTYASHVLCTECLKKLRILKEKTIQKYVEGSIYEDYEDYKDTIKTTRNGLMREIIRCDLLLDRVKKLEQKNTIQPKLFLPVEESYDEIDFSLKIEKNGSVLGDKEVKKIINNLDLSNSDFLVTLDEERNPDKGFTHVVSIKLLSGESVLESELNKRSRILEDMLSGKNVVCLLAKFGNKNYEIK
jgi:hypothetical protein